MAHYLNVVCAKVACYLERALYTQKYRNAHGLHGWAHFKNCTSSLDSAFIKRGVLVRTAMVGAPSTPSGYFEFYSLLDTN